MPEERRVAAWIGASLVIEGDLTSSEDMTVAGHVRGDVAVSEHSLIIAPEGRIRGNVAARSVTVHGEVSGTIAAIQKVEVSATGTLDGDITAPRMVVAEGAVLRGRVKIGAAASPPAEQREAASPDATARVSAPGVLSPRPPA
ncbi:MAG TPA: polymer-forming cytoskeletal protein [Longimicrobiales bacterium]|nr:polymer-forming cytoskeletal protein [Longimicrobiales bacterium]